MLLNKLKKKYIYIYYQKAETFISLNYKILYSTHFHMKY